MNVTIAIPDDVAVRLGSEVELERRALEALALEGYRAGRLTRPELGRMLGLEDGYALDGFLQAHGVAGATSASSDADREADDLVARFRAFAARHTLGGLDIKDLISEGRR